eukprot:scaffold102675_cov57-Phaeocystis_antarctica.AAC.4
MSTVLRGWRFGLVGAFGSVITGFTAEGGAAGGVYTSLLEPASPEGGAAGGMYTSLLEPATTPRRATSHDSSAASAYARSRSAALVPHSPGSSCNSAHSFPQGWSPYIPAPL